MKRKGERGQLSTLKSQFLTLLFWRHQLDDQTKLACIKFENVS